MLTENLSAHTEMLLDSVASKPDEGLAGLRYWVTLDASSETAIRLQPVTIFLGPTLAAFMAARGYCGACRRGGPSIVNGIVRETPPTVGICCLS